MLRTVLIALAVLAVVACVALFLTGYGSTGAIGAWIGFEAAIVLVALVAERGRYRPKTSEGTWTRTKERFLDPTSGQWMLVDFNPATGERRYVPDREARPPVA